jgi:hypothetical protein
LLAQHLRDYYGVVLGSASGFGAKDLIERAEERERVTARALPFVSLFDLT